MPYLKINDYKKIDENILNEIGKKIQRLFLWKVVTDEDGILLPFNNKNSSVLS